MVLHILMSAMFGMAVAAVSLQLHRALLRRRRLTHRRVRVIARACGIILVCFGLLIAIYGFMSGPVIAGVSALLYMLLGALLIFGKPQPGPAGAVERRPPA